jgi:hypothetical protein
MSTNPLQQAFSATMERIDALYSEAPLTVASEPTPEMQLLQLQALDLFTRIAVAERYRAPVEGIAS